MPDILSVNEISMMSDDDDAEPLWFKEIQRTDEADTSKYCSLSNVITVDEKNCLLYATDMQLYATDVTSKQTPLYSPCKVISHEPDFDFGMTPRVSVNFISQVTSSLVIQEEEPQTS